MQAHPEIPLNPTSDSVKTGVRSHVSRILRALEPGYGREVLKLEDQFFPEQSIADPGKAFYSQALSTLADDLFYSLRRAEFMDFAFSSEEKGDFDALVNGYE